MRFFMLGLCNKERCVRVHQMCSLYKCASCKKLSVGTSYSAVPRRVNKPGLGKLSMK